MSSNRMTGLVAKLRLESTSPVGSSDALVPIPESAQDDQGWYWTGGCIVVSFFFSCPFVLLSFCLFVFLSSLILVLYLFAKPTESEVVVALTKKLLESIAVGDWATYEFVCMFLLIIPSIG